MSINNPTHIILHHTSVSSANPQFNAVNNYHKSLNFPESSLGFNVGYHKFFERDGTVIIARAKTDEGAHTLKGWNRKSLGYCLAGNFDVESPTDAQIDSVRNEMEKDGLPFLLHREADTDRTCPGRYFSRDLVEMTETDELDKRKMFDLINEVEKLRTENSKLKEKVKALEKIREFWNNFIIKYFKK